VSEVRPIRVGVVQMTSTDDLPANLATADRGVREAAAQGAHFVALPEMFAYLRREGTRFPHAQGIDGAIVQQFRALASELAVRILAGSIAEAIPGQDRVYNTSVLIGPSGVIEAVYRKLHLFDIDLASQGGGTYRESASVSPGKDLVVASTQQGSIGLSICYDVRFPELYRELAARGARFLTVPSAFAPETGVAHWEILLRARAIENQAFVIAPAQCGRHSETRASYGHSLIADPWGTVLAELGDVPGVAVADCDLAAQDRIRANLPALRHRRL
jgi:deaminated glutathione amidase